MLACLGLCKVKAKITALIHIDIASHSSIISKFHKSRMLHHATGRGNYRYIRQHTVYFVYDNCDKDIHR